MDKMSLWDRRRFLQTGVGVLTGLGLSLTTTFAFANEARSERFLRLYNAHTEETAVVTYWADGEYIDSSLEEINYLLRDHRSKEIRPIDVGLIERLYIVNSQFGDNNWVEVLSGYRSPESNRALRRRSGKVASKSLHIEGRAVDIRIRGVKAEDIRDAALDLRLGGVGYYAKRHFVHIDSGAVRYWRA